MLFECSGQVTTWRLSTTSTVNIPILPQTARIDLQIWGIDDRGCYTLKQQVRLSDSDSVRNEKKEWVLSEPQYQLHFSEGDFIGFYVHSNGLSPNFHPESKNVTMYVVESDSSPIPNQHCNVASESNLSDSDVFLDSISPMITVQVESKIIHNIQCTYAFCI